MVKWKIGKQEIGLEVGVFPPYMRFWVGLRQSQDSDEIKAARIRHCFDVIKGFELLLAERMKDDLSAPSYPNGFWLEARGELEESFNLMDMMFPDYQTPHVDIQLLTVREYKQCAEYHLRTGYPNIYKKFVEHRNLKKKRLEDVKAILRERGYGCVDTISYAIVDGIHITILGCPSGPGHITTQDVLKIRRVQEIYEKLRNSYYNLYKDIRGIQVKAKYGVLKGTCKFCPQS